MMKKNLKELSSEERVARLKMRYNRGAGLVLFPLLLVAAYAFYLHTTRGEIVRSNYAMQNKVDSVSVSVQSIAREDSATKAENVALRAQNEGVIAKLSTVTTRLDIQVGKNVAAINYFARMQRKSNNPQIIMHYDTTTKTALIGRRRSDSVAVPQDVLYMDEHIWIAGTLTKDGVTLDSPVVVNSVSLKVTKKKRGFLNLGREFIVNAVNSNPYIHQDTATAVRLRR